MTARRRKTASKSKKRAVTQKDLGQLTKASIAVVVVIALATLAYIYIPGGTAPERPVTDTCSSSESYHIHAKLTLRQFLGLVNGNYTWRTFYAPAGVGLPPNAPCVRPLHTHYYDGIIHAEYDHPRDFTVQEFFAVWNQPFGSTNVANLTYNASIGPLRFNYRMNAFSYGPDGVVDTSNPEPWQTFDPSQPLVLKDGMEIAVGYPPQ